MGASYTHKCDKCEYSVNTSGPWEFYRDDEGTRKPYGHPGPGSEEAAKRGISGLSSKLYCPSCDKVSDLIVVEFKNPSFESLYVWAGKCEPLDKYKREGAVRCPHCDNQRLILESDKHGDVPCPRCTEGILRVKMNWIS